MINGVIIKNLSKYKDDRGWLMEVYRSDINKFKTEMCYLSHTEKDVVRGPHEHINQTDYFVFIGYGDFEFYLWDNRKDSTTHGERMKFVVGESNKVSVIVPPGVVHGYKSISESGSLCINLPDKLYAGEGKKDKVDEIRHENDIDSEFKIG